MIPFQMQQDIGPASTVAQLFDSPLNAVMRGEQQANVSKMQDVSLRDALEVLRQRQLENVGHEYDAKLAQAKMDPANGYIPSLLDGFKAQNQLQRNSADKSTALLPDQIKGEKQDLLLKFRRNDAIGQIQQIDDQITTEADPSRRKALEQLRNTITSQLKSTPEFTGKKELNDDDNATKRYIAEIQAAALRERAQLAAEKPKGPLNMSQLEAAMRARVAQDPNDLEAAGFLKELEGYKQRTTPGMGDVTLNPDTKQLVTRQQQLNGQTKPQQPQLPAGWSMK